MSIRVSFGILFLIIASGCAANEADVGAPESVETDSTEVSSGLIVLQSDADVETTYGRLIAALEANENISVMAEIDHEANAATVGLELRPIRVVLFGNPNLGTPLMQVEPTIAIDLPQKMLVWEGETGQVFVGYNDPHYIANRHGMSTGSSLPQIANALNRLANVAAGTPGN
ncbi:MAG: DUF302 domain-containing protein [Rubricoccaceae bacterium]|nr:DUF302 domain-containing protein [Rubricoccaceae bacterium]